MSVRIISLEKFLEKSQLVVHCSSGGREFHIVWAVMLKTQFMRLQRLK